MDPTRRGIGAAERYRRSRKLIELALESASRCAGSVLPPALRELAEKAQAALGSRIRASQMDDATEANIVLAEGLWQTGRKDCRPALTQAEEPLALVLAEVGQ
jgi:hypothetical protein